MLAHIVDGEDVWMVQRASRLRFELQSAQAIWIGGSAGENFDRDVTSQGGPRVTRAIHFSHSACAEQANYLVVTKTRAGNERRWRHRGGIVA